MNRLIYGLSCCGAVLLGCGSSPKNQASDGVVDNADGDRDETGEVPAADAGKRDARASNTGDAKRDARMPNTVDNSCESKTISARANPPDILIVMDRSLSMELGGRWQPSSTAVKQLTSEFEDNVQFGLMTFPANGLGACDPGKLDVPVEAKNAQAVNGFLDMTAPGGFTPTADTLKAALDALGDRTPPPDSDAKPAYVLLVTDGEPDCASPMYPDSEQGSIDAVTALAMAKIKTYVIGYNLAGGADLMNRMAEAGGTDKYFEVENQQDITDAFHTIAADIVKCEFELSEEPKDPNYVRVSIDGITVALNAEDGWILEGKTVTLKDAQCDVLRDGANHALEVKVECDPVTYL
jgi:Mg-chelatase subunit ChlD